MICILNRSDLETLFLERLKRCNPGVCKKELALILNLEVAEVLSDAKWLSFIIRQLLTNAVKYSEASDIIINSYQQDEQTSS